MHLHNNYFGSIKIKHFTCDFILSFGPYMYNMAANTIEKQATKKAKKDKATPTLTSIKIM